MSLEPEGIQMLELQPLKVSSISQNPENPRLHFPEEELQRLAESISKEGILVPIVVYKEKNKYILVDGERRWRCAIELGLDRIPAVIAKPTDAKQKLLQMFNIHMVRDPWDDMPTAWALEKLIDETGVKSDTELSDLTGLSTERIKRLRHALELPKQYQHMINDGRIPLNFFWELKRSVIEPLSKLRPAVWAEFGDKEILKAFVGKRQAEVITDAISLRKVRAIVSVAAREAESPEETSILDHTIKQLISDPEMTIDDAYEDTVEVVIEADKLQRRSENIVRSFKRLFAKAHNAQERKRIQGIARKLSTALKSISG